MKWALLVRSAAGRIATLTVATSLVPLMLGLVPGWAPVLGFVPARISGGDWLAALTTPLSATMLHGSLLHLGANMLMLLWCGIAVERVLGLGAVMTLYLVGAYAAAAAQFVAGPTEVAPMIGASGAISALVGAFALSFGEQKRLVAGRALNRTLNTLWLLAAWIVVQVGLGYLMGAQGTLMATPAHIGGFIAGVLLQRPLLLWHYRKA